MHTKHRKTQPRAKTQIGTPHLGQFLRDLAGYSYRVPRRLLTQWRGEQGGKVMKQFLRTKTQAEHVAAKQAVALRERREHFAAVAASRRAERAKRTELLGELRTELLTTSQEAA